MYPSEMVTESANRNHIVLGHESLQVVQITDVKNNCLHSILDNGSVTEFSVTC